uniref:Dynein heavy chain tail domain-containing protein n=1 Tax=Monopterus albus TaxID=43700 RepID=A0A3Q3JEF4_MONAL
MSDDERVPSFVEDVRVKFVEEKVCGLLQLPPQTWEKSAVSEGFQTLLKDFFGKESVIFFSSSLKGCLVASKEVSYGCSTASPITFISSFISNLACTLASQLFFLCGFLVLPCEVCCEFLLALHKVCVPLLANYKNHHMWPNLMSEDIIRHVERMCWKTSVLREQVIGKTVLPIPNVTDWMENSFFDLCLYAKYKSLAHTIETQVINWTSLIQKILKEDSSDLLSTGCNPGPVVELKFWASRKSNIQNIYHQLQSPIVQKMAKVLEMMDSSYHPTIKTLTGNVFDALQEAQDIDLHLQPLHKQLSQLENKGFLHFETSIPALFHTIFLIWTTCRSYQRPAHIVVLLQELCNVLIEQASEYLSADLLIRDEPEEGLQMVKRVIKIFRSFTDSYQTQREKLSSHVKHAPWDFPSELFGIMLEFQRIEKLEFGGLKGKLYSEHAAQMYKEFSDHCQVLKHSENSPLDLNSLYVFFFRRQIRQIFSPSFLWLQQLFREELENCIVHSNMVHTSGTLKWAKMLRERIQTPWEKIRLLVDMSAKIPY